MILKERVELLGRAAGELAAFIAAHNLKLKKQITSQTETEPDYMDMQTCHELQVLANSIEVSEGERIIDLSAKLDQAIDMLDLHQRAFLLNKWGKGS